MTDSAVVDATATEPTQSSTVAKALKELANDRKAWRKMAQEVAEGKQQKPPSIVLERLANAFEIAPDQAAAAFDEDCKAIKAMASAKSQLKTYDKKKADFLKQHAAEQVLQEQLASLIEEEKNLRNLIRKIQHVDFVRGTQQAKIRQTGSLFERAFGDD